MVIAESYRQKYILLLFSEAKHYQNQQLLSIWMEGGVKHLVPPECF